ncbi:MAG TPA: hypothetical protein VNH83_18865, partial [Bryobacteraceae bacterium]|nr:hypothetical protein [Bryobacteraceae bacterium]
TTAEIVRRAPQYGADVLCVYDDKWLMETEFYRLNQWLWTYPENQPAPSPRAPRGFGWFSWKPFIIMDALSRCAPGDIVMYTDADTYPIADFRVLYEECERVGGVMLFAAQGRNNRFDCSRDCFVVMAQDEPRYHDMQAGVARFMLFQRNDRNWKQRQFLMEWQTYCLNKRATTFEPSQLKQELDGFSEHRTEQAIMTLLGAKYGYKFYREACAFGNGASEDKELYGQLFCQEGNTGARTLEGSAFRNMDHSGIGG